MYSILTISSDPPTQPYVIQSDRPIKLGDDATLTCNVDDLGYPTANEYVWLYSSNKGKGTIIPGETSKNLVIRHITEHDLGYYSCKVKNEIAEQLSNVSRLNILGELKYVY